MPLLLQFPIALLLFPITPTLLNYFGINYEKNIPLSLTLIDLLMGLFRGAVFCHGGGARNSP